MDLPLAALFLIDEDGPSYEGVLTTFTVGIVVLIAVGLAACTGPTLRALRVDPSETLRSEG